MPNVATLRSREQRAATRHEVELEARICVGNILVESTLRNVSRSGAFATLDRLPLGTEVRVWFRIPSANDVIEVDAVVRWTTDAGIGLQFGGLRARDAWALGVFLDGLKHGRPPT